VDVQGYYQLCGSSFDVSPERFTMLAFPNSPFRFFASCQKQVSFQTKQTRRSWTYPRLALSLLHSFHTSPVPDAFTYVHPFLFSSSLGFPLTSSCHHVDSSTAVWRCLTVLSRLFFRQNPLFTIGAIGLSLALRLHKWLWDWRTMRRTVRSPDRHKLVSDAITQANVPTRVSVRASAYRRGTSCTRRLPSVATVPATTAAPEAFEIARDSPVIINHHAAGRDSILPALCSRAQRRARRCARDRAFAGHVPKNGAESALGDGV